MQKATTRWTAILVAILAAMPAARAEMRQPQEEPGAAAWGRVTRSAVGADIHYTLVRLPNFQLHAAGVAESPADRVELSLSRESLAPEGLAPEGLAPEGLAPEGLASDFLSNDGVTVRPFVPAEAGYYPGDAFSVFLTFFLGRAAVRADGTPASRYLSLLAGF